MSAVMVVKVNFMVVGGIGVVVFVSVSVSGEPLLLCRVDVIKTVRSN